MTTDKTPTDAEIAALYADETGFALGASHGQAPATQQAGATKEHVHLVRVIADKIEDGTLFRSGIYSNKDLARFVRNVADAAAPQFPTTQAQADSVQEDAAREAIEKVLALFPFNVPIQKFTVNNGPCLTADNDDEFYSVKRVLAFLTEIKTTLDAARKQGEKQ